MRSHTTTVILPASALRPLIRDRLIVGSAASPETCLLMTHVNMVNETFGNLTPTSAQAAHNALIELVKGVLRQRADVSEPHLAPAPAQAAGPRVTAPQPFSAIVGGIRAARAAG
ncbi:hypothetical protein [Streptosporangium sp. NPDC087985]|uniref:hypothetical protein n=1 Tax=Streptosporangium sp. NPDC087985 TaxID=3366196 RepID=UPI0038061646